MLGAALRDAIAGDVSPRQAAIFGHHGAHVNITDGRYVYMRAPASSANEPLFNYTLMPAHMRDMFEPGELERAELASPFAFTKGCPLLKVPRRTDGDFHGAGSLLFDLENDPRQKQPLHDAAQERRLAGR